MPAPLFSLVIPCYNHARFLPEAVNSVAAQHFDALEVIIINDGSTDDTADVVRDLLRHKACPGLRSVEQPNLGLAMARNAGIAQASGEWIVALDSDDILADGFLHAVAGHVRERRDLSVVTGAYREFGARESDWRLSRYDPERFFVLCNILACSPFRRRLWEQAGGYAPDNPWGGEDWHFWIKCHEHGFSFEALPVPMLRYRIHDSGSMTQDRAPQYAEFLAMHYTMAPNAYPREVLYEAHRVLARMSEASEAAVRKKIRQLPDLALPYFWLALLLEERGEHAAARAACQAARSRPWPGAWQASSLFP